MSDTEINTAHGNERSTQTDKPFCWSSLAALRTIREQLGAGPSSFAIAAYVSLCSMAAIQKSQKFTCTIAQIAGHAGLRYRKTAVALDDLERLKLVAIKRNTVKVGRHRQRLPSTYTLLSTKSKTDGVRSNMPKGCAQYAEGVAPNGTKGLRQRGTPSVTDSIIDTKTKAANAPFVLSSEKKEGSASHNPGVSASLAAFAPSSQQPFADQDEFNVVETENRKPQTEESPW
jgi:hypothetical protein